MNLPLLRAVIAIAAAAGASLAIGSARSFAAWDPPTVLEDPLGDTRFGTAASIDRGTLAVGCDRDEDGLVAEGRVHLFERGRGPGRWRSVQVLTAPGAPLFDRFGASVAVVRDRLLVGAPGDSMLGPFAGRAHLFRHDGQAWRIEASLADPLGAAADEFGRSVALHERVAAVGSPRADSAGLDAGRVTLFEPRGGVWEVAASLTAPGGRSGDWFGHALDTDGTRVAVGAYGDDEGGSGSGAVHLFRREGDRWRHEQTLRSPQPRPSEWFGFAVAIEGEWLLAGVPRHSGLATSSGAAWVFRLVGGEWRPHAMLQPAVEDPADAEQSWFGYAIAFTGDVAAIASPGRRGPMQEDGPMLRAGRCDLFRREGGQWGHLASLGEDPPAAETLFGAAVAIDAATVAVGHLPAEDVEPRTGRAWIFERPPRRGRRPRPVRIGSAPGSGSAWGSHPRRGGASGPPRTR